jgi:hypothetical protein
MHWSYSETVSGIFAIVLNPRKTVFKEKKTVIFCYSAAGPRGSGPRGSAQNRAAPTRAAPARAAPARAARARAARARSAGARAARARAARACTDWHAWLGQVPFS